MIHQAQREIIFRFKKPYFLGDKSSENYAGLAAGIGTNPLFSMYPRPELNRHQYQAVQTLLETLPLMNSIRQ